MRDGVIGEFTVAENIMLVDYDERPYSKRGLLNFGEIARHCSGMVERYNVKTPSIRHSRGTCPAATSRRS